MTETTVAIAAAVALLVALAGPGSAAPVAAQGTEERLWLAQQPGNCLIVAASRRTLDQSLDFIRGLPERRDVRLFRSSNGWFAITVAEVPSHDSAFYIQRLIARGYPGDMFCSTGSRFGREIDWTAEMRAPPAPSAPVMPSRPSRPEVFKSL